MAFHLLISSYQHLAKLSLLLYMSVASSFISQPEGGSSTNNNGGNTAVASSVLKGVDVSRWQKEVDWHRVKEADITFAFVKATQADFRLDPYFPANWEATKRVGIKRGAYHFFIPSAPIQGQIEIFKSTVTLEAGDLPPVLDVETADPLMTGEQLRQNMRLWLETIQQHYGVKPIIYTNQNFYRRWLQGHFQDFHFWIARYSDVAPEVHHNEKWMFWQYSDRGTIPGINTAVDMNFFVGDWDSLSQLCMPEMVFSSEEVSPLKQLKHMQPLPY
ncbi:glycoside hydrolase family 25 protein [Pontibacter silvestris]|uniref:Glycoside hydrolase family 25 protein n=1 Tax=Pontibacter silvestris TaxID=2305183 RepID=A0ABW4WX19_9BACT|nr:GH25 family lysozyme [Pontibacter silvestris]MCC9136690.1 lysozyme [Pontibacter silvestris]